MLATIALKVTENLEQTGSMVWPSNKKGSMKSSMRNLVKYRSRSKCFEFVASSKVVLGTPTSTIPARNTDFASTQAAQAKTGDSCPSWGPAVL